MEIGDTRAQEIRDIQQRLGKIDFATSPDVRVAPRYSADYERAALLSSFGSDEFDLRSTSVRELLKDCAVDVLDDAVRYVLNTDVRRRVLRQLGSRERMQVTLQTVENVPSDSLQEAINRIVDNENVVDDGASIGWMQTAYRALSWFADIIPTESVGGVRARIEAVGLLERFERLVGDNFRGREQELREMRDYVGVLLPATRFVARLLERRTSFDEKPALVITGPGGIGKSTLLAKFILDHASLTDDRQLPFAYINFDSPTVRAGDSKTILIEALRQLAIEYPDFTLTIGTQRDRWQTALLELSRLTDSAQLAREIELTDIFRREFVSLLTSIQINDRPLLFILDTFEIVQERQRNDISTVYRFLRQLQAEYPALRVVISGRAGLGDAVDTSATIDRDPANEIRTRELKLTGLDRETSTDYLVHAGLTREHAVQVAGYLIPDDATEQGASPLSLRVAAEIWRRDIERSELDTTFWAQLRAGRIQAQLITRYVRHTDPESLAGKLALPSLLLRRITPEALTAVVAPAWEIPLERRDADAALGELARLISLVIERAGRALEPRQEVQRQVVELLGDLESTRVRRLHDLAVDHYSSLSGRVRLDKAERDQARFDEIVHRLARGDDDHIVRLRWNKGCADLVIGRIPLLSTEAQAVLDQLAGIELTGDMHAVVSLHVWQVDAVKRARRALDTGDPQTVVSVAAERDDWSRASELSLVLAQAHLAVDALVDALDVAGAAISATEPGVSSGLASDLHQVAAEAAYELDQPQDALNYVDDALTIAREREDVPRLVVALLLRATVQQHRDQRAANDAVDELQQFLAILDGPLAEKDALRLFGLVERFPTLVPAAVRCGGLVFLTPTSSRQLARAITTVDEQVSAELGADPGLLAIAAGLSVGTSVTRTWQDALDRGARTAVPAVLEALRHDVPARATLVDSLAAQLGAVALNRQPAEESTVGSIGLRLNQRRRRELVEALLSESGRMELEGILADEFDRSLSSVTSLDAGDEHAISELVEIAEREQRLGALIIAVRNKRPSAPRMLQIANELDLSTIHFSAGRLASATGRYDFDRVLARLGDLEGQIGRLELGSELIGTGLLVAPDILLVSASSLGGDQQLADGPGLHVRFGLKADSKGRRHDEGTLFPLQRDWLIDEIPYAGGSGFTLLRVAGYPADEPLGSGRAESMHLRRGFADISRSADMMEGQNALICWQQRSRLELHIERRALTRAGDVFTLPSLGDSSEGAPCFSRSMEFLGLVLENRAGVARIVPGVDLWQSLQDHGHGDTVGVGLS